VFRTWILQANPKLYDVDGALSTRPVIYWRIPQYTEQLRAGDRALIWRAGKEAGFVGWGVFRTDPQRYDLSSSGEEWLVRPWREAEHYAPVAVWPGQHVPKATVATVLPEHRIITAPMGTVFSLDGDELATLQPLLASGGYDLQRLPSDGFSPLPLLPEKEQDAKPKSMAAPPGAKITPALFLLSSTPERPVEVTIEGDALRLLLVERDALNVLDETWDSVGVYLLVDEPVSEDATLSVYVGKAQGLRSRIRGHSTKTWARCLLVQREGRHPYNASDISWLERRLIDVFLEAPEIDLINKNAPPPEHVPGYKGEILERTVIAVLGVLGLLGAYVS
jgi:hypothetical protein